MRAIDVASRGTIVLCDDNPCDGGPRTPKPFWHGRKEWLDGEWPEWELRRIAAPGESGPWVERFVNEIRSVAGDKPIYVVTDGNFGSDMYGGAQLLNVINSRLVRGVVLSIEPHLLPEQGLSLKLWALEDGHTGHEAELVRQFFVDGTRGGISGLDHSIRLLSRTIHGLENLAVPLRIDAETLSVGIEAREVMKSQTIRDILSANFAKEGDARAKELGYLSRDRPFTESRNGIEGEIARLIAPLASLECVSRCTAFKSLILAGRIDEKVLESHLNVEQARKTAAELYGQIKDTIADNAIVEVAEPLRDQLVFVANAIGCLASELRLIRDEEMERGTK